MEIQEIISSGKLEMYALGLTSVDETKEVEGLISMHPELTSELNSIEKAMESYAMAHAVEPGKDLKQKIQINLDTNSNINNYETTAKVYSMSPFWKWAAAASIILLIGSSILNVVYYTKYDKVNTALLESKQELIAQNDKLTKMDRDLNVLNRDMTVVQSKYSEPVSLHGLPAAPDAAAKVFWMKNTTGEVYLDPSNLPEAPTGMQYQLWAIVDGKPVDGGLIVNTKKGNKYQIQKMKTFGKAEAFAVTLETTGGNPTPKGEMYVMGKM